MNIFTKPVAILGLAGAAAFMLPATSMAQGAYFGPPGDTWAHVTSPAPWGLCWIQTDMGPYKEFGYGYWGSCPSSVKAAPSGMRARAQVMKPSKPTKPSKSKAKPKKKMDY